MTRIKQKAVAVGEVLRSEPPDTMIDGWLPFGSLTVLYGPPKTFKSFVALDMAASVASRHQWQGQRTDREGVLYVAAEGYAGYRPRLEAWMAHHSISPERLDWLHFYPERVDLADDVVMADLAQYVVEAEKGLVVIDTLARCMPGVDENSAKEMSRVIENVDMVRGEFHTVLAVHHAGKDTTKGMRGHSALLGAVDAALSVTRVGKNRVTVEAVAMKDFIEPPPLQLTMQTVGPSLVPVYAAPDSRKGVRPDALVRAMEALSDVIVEQPGISKNSARQHAKGRTDDKKVALELLETGGWMDVDVEGVGRPHRCRMLRPYRGINDPMANNYDPTAEVPPPCA